MVLGGQAQAVQHLMSGDPVGRSLTLTVAGHTVSAMYAYRADVPGQAAHFLTYKLGQATVRIVGSGQSKAQFFAVIKALVDGKTHPGVDAQLQHELDTP